MRIRKYSGNALVGLTIAALLGWTVVAGPAQAAERLTLYCSPQIEWCQLMVAEFEKRTGILFHFDNSVGDHPLDEARAITLFRIFQETLTNVARHANARRIHATLSEEEEWVTLTVADDGCGIAPERISHPESLGLLGMQERASAWGGQVAIEGEPGKGTTITIRLKKEAHEHIGQH